MFTFGYFSIALVMVTSVALANPAGLQNLYGAPVNDHSHHSADLEDSRTRPGNVDFGSHGLEESSSSNDILSSVTSDDTTQTESGGARDFIINSGAGSTAGSNGEPIRSADTFGAGAASSSSSDSFSSLNNAGNAVTGGRFEGPGAPLSPRIVILSPADLSGIFGSNSQADITITRVETEDVFTTIANVFYNTIPVTLTQFMKTTAVAPTFQIISTAVDDKVFVATAPVTHTDTVTVLDTRTAHQFATEVSTDVYTITHSAFDIRQQVVTSTVIQTQVFRPTVVRTKIDTEYDTQTVVHTVTNTVISHGNSFVGNSFSGSSLGRLPVPEGLGLPSNVITSAFGLGLPASGPSFEVPRSGLSFEQDLRLQQGVQQNELISHLEEQERRRVHGHGHRYI